LADNEDIEKATDIGSADSVIAEAKQAVTELEDTEGNGLNENDPPVAVPTQPDADNDDETCIDVNTDDETDLLYPQSAQASLPGDISYDDTFEDENFRKCVLQLLHKDDSEKSDQFSDEDRNDFAIITELDVSYKEISNLKGIEYFTGLEILNVEGNYIEVIDLSNNGNLRTFNIDFNVLIELDVSHLKKLEILEARTNNLTRLDLSENLNLAKVYVSDNQLIELLLPNSDKLKVINALCNYLTEIDVSNNPNLEELDLSSNQIESLNVQNNKALYLLAIEYNGMKSSDSIKGWIGGDGKWLSFVPQEKLLPPAHLLYDNKGMVSWGSAKDAQWYRIYVDGVLDVYTVKSNICYFDLRDILRLPSFYTTEKNYLDVFKVQVLSFIGDNPQLIMAKSDLSEPVSVDIRQLDTPEEISIDEEDGCTLRWRTVSGALEYILFIDDSDGQIIETRIEALDESDSYTCTDLSELKFSSKNKDSYEIKVRAIAVSENIGISEISDSVSYDPKTDTGGDGNGDDGKDENGNNGNTGNTSIVVDWTPVVAKFSIIYGTSNNSAFTPALPINGSAKKGDLELEGEFITSDDIMQVGNDKVITVTFTVTSEENKGKEVTKDFKVTVNKKPLSTNMIAINGVFTYTGNAIVPGFSVADGSLLKDSDYTSSIKNNENAGNASIIIEATSTGNYSGTATRGFSIAKAKPQGTPIFTKITSDGKTLADANLSLPSGGFKNASSGKEVPGILSWDDGNTKKVTGKTAYKWTFTPKDTNNYLTLTGSIILYPSGIPEDDPQDDEMVGKLFIDVLEGVWYEDAVTYMYENGLMNGTSKDMMIFSPNIPLSRAMIATIIYRQEGEPDTSGSENPFSDIPEEIWYTNAVLWMAENDIVKGYPDGRFGPNDNISRQDLAVILARYADYKEIELPVKNTYKGFDDEDSIDEYALDAVQCCFEAGIINGKNDGSIFDPTNNATRAEAAVMLYRFLFMLQG
jgi:hypothetical protein